MIFIVKTIPGEEAALVDNKFYVTLQECDSGFAEVGDDIIDRSEYEVSKRSRSLGEKSILIGTHFNPFMRQENRRTAESFLTKYNGGTGITKENFLEPVRKMRQHKYQRRLLELILKPTAFHIFQNNPRRIVTAGGEDAAAGMG